MIDIRSVGDWLGLHSLRHRVSHGDQPEILCVAARGLARLRLACAIGLAATMMPVIAAEDGPYWFGQADAGDHRVKGATFGIIQSFRSPEARAHSRWDFYGELSIGRWRLEPDDRSASRHATQIGFTPVGRYSFGDQSSAVFVEAGIGLNAIAPVLHSEDRRFSTVFNFGDHLGIGRRFGTNGNSKLVFRIQHYSNGGIKNPNPGQDFVQVRIAHRF